VDVLDMQEMKSGETVIWKAELRGRKVVVRDSTAIEFLAQRGYGIARGGVLELELVEAAYLLDRGVITVEDEGKQLSFIDLVKLGAKEDPDFWAKLGVYTDLRNRALVVMPGVTSYELLVDWKRRDSARRFLVRIVKEGVRIGFADLEEMHRRALESDRELVLAIVDKEGVITYYTVEGVAHVAHVSWEEDLKQAQPQQEG